MPVSLLLSVGSLNSECKLVLAAIVINIVLVSVAVVIHYEMLRALSWITPKIRSSHRFKIVLGIVGSLLAHVVEIWVFAFAYYLMIGNGDLGNLTGNFQNSLSDCLYFSITTYTSLGFGDIEPSGAIRFVAGIEALTGLVLITWTASFMFIEMSNVWKQDK